MLKMDRNDIEIISGHSNWSEDGVSKALSDHVYSGKNAWQRFLAMLFLGLGISFSTTGIVFFFAFNWDSLHRFTKLGLVQGLIVLTFSSVLLFKFKPLVQKIVLSSISVLVGVLLAVFGQVYQTGANAYDLFLAWTLFISIWVLVANFAPLWVIYIALFNITLVLYAEQVAHSWDEMLLSILLFGINSLFLISFMVLPKWTKLKPYPSWFTNLMALTVVTIGTVGVSNGVFEKTTPLAALLLLSTLVLFGAGIWFGLKTKSLFYLSIVPFGLIIIFCAFLLNISDDAGMLFAVGVFIIASISLLIKILLGFQKKWTK